ncbi:4-alpha-glucanotransferase, partial [Chloroflexota bacterium]
MGITAEKLSINELARWYDVQVAYNDVEHRRRQVSVEALMATLRALGAPIHNIKDISSAIKERRQALWQQWLEPVAVAWNGRLPPLKLRLPSQLSDTSISIHISLEYGETINRQYQIGDLPEIETAEVNGIKYIAKHLPIPVKLPLGYHHLTLELSGKSMQILLISAPLKAYTRIDELDKRDWGIFIPLYALHPRGGYGIGDFSDLELMMTWMDKLGGKIVATLPLLSTFYEND